LKSSGATSLDIVLTNRTSGDSGNATIFPNSSREPSTFPMFNRHPGATIRLLFLSRQEDPGKGSGTTCVHHQVEKSQPYTRTDIRHDCTSKFGKAIICGWVNGRMDSLLILENDGLTGKIRNRKDSARPQRL
jgi:hypothetical protein